VVESFSFFFWVGHGKKNLSEIDQQRKAFSHNLRLKEGPETSARLSEDSRIWMWQKCWEITRFDVFFVVVLFLRTWIFLYEIIWLDIVGWVRGNFSTNNYCINVIQLGHAIWWCLIVAAFTSWRCSNGLTWPTISWGGEAGWYGTFLLIYRVSYVPGSAGFLPSTVSHF